MSWTYFFQVFIFMFVILMGTDQIVNTYTKNKYLKGGDKDGD